VLSDEEVERLREFHRKAGYSSDFPDVKGMAIGDLVRDGDRVVGFIGAEMEAQVVGIFDPDWGSPHQRVKKFAELHLPIAEELERRGVKTATVHIDPVYKNFGNRLSKLGWNRTRWETYRMKVSDCIKALKNG
jgi:hypothetical protein